MMILKSVLTARKPSLNWAWECCTATTPCRLVPKPSPCPRAASKEPGGVVSRAASKPRPSAKEPRDVVPHQPRLLCLALVVWGGGAVKERGRLGPDYFCPPLSQVREPASWGGMGSTGNQPNRPVHVTQKSVDKSDAQ